MTYTDPYDLTGADAALLGREIGNDFWRAFQGFEVDGDLAKSAFRLALEAAAYEAEMDSLDETAEGLAFHPRVRREAVRRTVVAVRGLVGFAEAS